MVDLKIHVVIIYCRLFFFAIFCHFTELAWQIGFLNAKVIGLNPILGSDILYDKKSLISVLSGEEASYGEVVLNLSCFTKFEIQLVTTYHLAQMELRGGRVPRENPSI